MFIDFRVFSLENRFSPGVFYAKSDPKLHFDTLKPAKTAGLTPKTLFYMYFLRIIADNVADMAPNAPRDSFGPRSPDFVACRSFFY
jgi:hypothetical protein